MCYGCKCEQLADRYRGKFISFSLALWAKNSRFTLVAHKRAMSFGLKEVSADEGDDTYRISLERSEHFIIQHIAGTFFSLGSWLGFPALKAFAKVFLWVSIELRMSSEEALEVQRYLERTVQ